MISLIDQSKPCNLIIFGAKGDLSKRKLLPALYKLEKNKQIHIESKIIGVGRANWSCIEFSNIVYKALIDFMEEKINEKIWINFSKKLNFFNLDVNDTANFINLHKIINYKKRITISYLAVSPHHFKAICQGLASVKLNIFPSRIILEKPLGHSLKSSSEINSEVSKFFEERQIFRIDHYLGKETILNLLTLRFANSFFFNNWDYKTIDHVQITVAEDMGIEGRWEYFDKIGQMRDMVQNHLLQILTIIAMSPPNNLSTDSIRDEKVKVLRALRPINKKNIKENTIRGQYTDGIIDGKKVPGYLEEGNIKKSNTETFVYIKVNIDNWRWQGVPFYLRSGKRLMKKYSEIVIYFKSPILNLFKNSFIKLPKNKLIIRLQPNEGITIQIINKIPGLEGNYKLKKINLDLYYSKNFNNAYLADAYERLLLESMRGIQSLFVSKDEVEEAWKWIDSIIDIWSLNKTNIDIYQAGTLGPLKSINIIKKDGRCWN